MKKASKYIIRVYQLTLSPGTGAIPRALGIQKAVCSFYPTCSAYASVAIDKHGILKGGLLSAWRVLRCYPFRMPSIDPVPDTLSFKRSLR